MFGTVILEGGNIYNLSANLAFLPGLYVCFAHMHEKQGAAERDQGFSQLALWHQTATHAGQPVGLGAALGAGAEG